MEVTEKQQRTADIRSIGLGLITGAANDDPSAVGTFASAGAKLGPSFLWIAPAMFPMMITAVYLSSKLGMVSGEGLFALIRRHYPRWFLLAVLTGVLIGNVIEAGADMGGIAAALSLIIPAPIRVITVAVAIVIPILQIKGSYALMRNIFRVLALALLAYIAAALLAHPDPGTILRNTFIPVIRLNRDFLTMIVATIGTTLSAYLYTWQSNEEVEEEIEAGRTRLAERKGATPAELNSAMWDAATGMCFSCLVMYSILLSTSATLFVAGKTDISSAADAARALEPIAGRAAALLFALGVAGAGFLAVPVMTVGAAWNLAQTLGWKYGLYRKPGDAKKFYTAIGFFTLIAAGLNFLGINPMKALVFSAIVQGISAPPLLFLIMRMTNNPVIMGSRVNGRAINIFGWITTAAAFAATAGFAVSWIIW
jgi:Mn2+/Fe2+ NRAMP family transporter